MCLEQLLQIRFTHRHIAERPIRFEALAVAQKQRGAPRVDQRDHAEEDFVRELFDVQRAGNRQTDVVERFELPQPVFELEVALAHFLRESLIGDDSSDERGRGAEQIEIVFGIFAAGQCEEAEVIAAIAERDEDAVGGGDDFNGRIIGENLRRDELLAFRGETHIRIAIAEINGASFKWSMSRKGGEDCVAAR